MTVASEPAYRSALRHGVAAAIEHDEIPFGHKFASVVDVGAGRGQFALVARRRFPAARIYCFEPLDEARAKLLAVTTGLENVRVFDVALGAARQRVELHVASNLDSSSLLPMTDLHVAAFPGTAVTDGAAVAVARLEDMLEARDLRPPSLLKIDAQGYELDVLRGAGGLLEGFTEILVECSFVELYESQALADEVICYLHGRGLRLRGAFSVARDETGRCLQADLLFERQQPDAALV